jgi:hypothetical protein
MAESDDLRLRPTDATVEERIFDFFGLARELRNEIYPMLTEDVEVQNGCRDSDGDGDRFHVTVRNKLLLTPLLLNHQFKEEYEQETKHHEALVFEDTGCVLEDIKPWRYAPGPTRVRARLLLILDADCMTDDGVDAVTSLRSMRHGSTIRSKRSAMCKMSRSSCVPVTESQWTQNARSTFAKHRRNSSVCCLSR